MTRTIVYNSAEIQDHIACVALEFQTEYVARVIAASIGIAEDVLGPDELYAFAQDCIGNMVQEGYSDDEESSDEDEDRSSVEVLRSLHSRPTSRCTSTSARTGWRIHWWPSTPRVWARVRTHERLPPSEFESLDIDACMATTTRRTRPRSAAKAGR